VIASNNVTYTYGAASARGQGGNTVGRITHITDAAGTVDRQYGCSAQDWCAARATARS
jgi:hypothetical protein